MSEDTYQAEDTRRILNDMKQNMQEWDNIPGSFRSVVGITEKIVEDGTFAPDVNLTAELDLTLRERVTGRREQDMTAMFIMGAMIGTALERDVPMDSYEEEVWRNGGFTLPDSEDNNE